jgi:hypothetical protein
MNGKEFGGGLCGYRVGEVWLRLLLAACCRDVAALRRQRAIPSRTGRRLAGHAPLLPSVAAIPE